MNLIITLEHVIFPHRTLFLIKSNQHAPAVHTLKSSAVRYLLVEAYWNLICLEGPSSLQLLIWYIFCY